MNSQFEEIPHRIFLDSSTLQTIQDYGAFLYENEIVPEADPIYRDANGIDKLEALRLIMQIAERAPFEFALSNNSFTEVQKKGDSNYLQWAYDVLDHWLTCLDTSGKPQVNQAALDTMDSNSYGYISQADRVLLKDAISLDCDTFLTMENRLPKNADHIEKTLGIRVLTPVGMWEYIRPWKALFY